MFSRLIPLWAKSNKQKYSSVKTLIGVFFGPDYDIFGQDINEIMINYTSTVNDASRAILRDQLNALLDIQDDAELDSIMSELAENQFRPEPWGETWRSYLSKIKNYLV
ncbi:contact-dependent growth inhibition system immunity protein [Brenneria goodwinii]|uniref:contact-dependent growth inhibition system immunity protein n=1 Tax=Brenneria goodwinii TaxID=1109412 RepID=UPI0036E8C48F